MSIVLRVEIDAVCLELMIAVFIAASVETIHPRRMQVVSGIV